MGGAKKTRTWLARNYVTTLAVASRLHHKEQEPFTAGEVFHEIFLLEGELAESLGDRYEVGSLQVGPATLYRALSVLATKDLITVEEHPHSRRRGEKNLHSITEEGLWRTMPEVVGLSVRRNSPIPPDLDAFKIMTGEAIRAAKQS